LQNVIAVPWLLEEASEEDRNKKKKRKLKKVASWNSTKSAAKLWPARNTNVVTMMEHWKNGNNLIMAEVSACRVDRIRCLENL